MSSPGADPFASALIEAPKPTQQPTPTQAIGGSDPFSGALIQAQPQQNINRPVPTKTVGEAPYTGILNFASGYGFQPPDKNPNGVSIIGLGHHTPGSEHYKKEAVDFRSRDKKPEQVDAFIKAALAAGYSVEDARDDPSQPHVHIQKNPFPGGRRYITKNTRPMANLEGAEATQGVGSPEATKARQQATVAAAKAKGIKPAPQYGNPSLTDAQDAVDLLNQALHSQHPGAMQMAANEVDPQAQHPTQPNWVDTQLHSIHEQGLAARKDLDSNQSKGIPKWLKDANAGAEDVLFSLFDPQQQVEGVGQMVGGLMTEPKKEAASLIHGMTDFSNPRAAVASVANIAFMADMGLNAFTKIKAGMKPAEITATDTALGHVDEHLSTQEQTPEIVKARQDVQTVRQKLIEKQGTEKLTNRRQQDGNLNSNGTRQENGSNANGKATGEHIPVQNDGLGTQTKTEISGRNKDANSEGQPSGQHPQGKEEPGTVNQGSNPSGKAEVGSGGLKEADERAFMSGANQEANAFRREIGLDLLSPADKKRWGAIFAEAQDKNLHNDTKRIIADIHEGKPITEHDQAGLTMQTWQLKKDYRALLGDEARARKSGDLKALEGFQKRKADLQAEADEITAANKKAGTKSGTTLGIRGAGLNEDMDIVSLKATDAAEVGKPIDAKTEKRYQQIAADNDRLNAAMDKLVAERDQLLEQAKTTGRSKVTTMRGSMDPVKAKAEAERHWKTLERQLVGGMKSKQAGAIRMPNDPLPIFSKIVEAEIKGGLDLDAAVKKVVEDAKTRLGEDVDPHELLTEFSGYKRTAPKAVDRQSVAYKLRQAKREALLLTKLEALKQGESQAPKNKAVNTPRIESLQKELNQLRKEQGAPEKSAKNLATVKADILDLESQLRTGVIKPPEIRTLPQVSEELGQLRGKRTQLQAKAKGILNQRKLTKIERGASKFAGLSTEIKLYNPQARAIDVTSNTLQSGEAALFGRVDRAGANRILKGKGLESLNTPMSPEMKAEIKARLGVESKRDWVEHSGEYASKSGFEGPAGRFAGWLDEPFRVRHAMNWIGERAQNIADKRNFTPDQYGELVDQIRNPDQPGPISQAEAFRIREEADQYAHGMVFTSANVASKTVAHVARAIQDSKMHPAAKASATYALRITSQFSKVLVNIADNTAQYSNPVWAAIRYGVEKHKLGTGNPLGDAVIARRAAQIARRSGVGTAMVLYGYFNYDPKSDSDPNKNAWQRVLLPELVETVNKKTGKGTGKVSFQNEGLLSQVGGMMSAYTFGQRIAQIVHRAPEQERAGLFERLVTAPITDNPIAGNLDTLSGVFHGDPGIMQKLRGWAVGLYFPGGINAAARDQMQAEGIYTRRKEDVKDEYKARIPGLQAQLPAKGLPFTPSAGKQYKPPKDKYAPTFKVPK
jgi:hypothetical protein